MSAKTTSPRTTAEGASVRPFEITVPEEDLVELRRRIAAVRLPSKELVSDRSQGVQLKTIQELARYWTTEYNWRRCEARLNALPQFKTTIDGEDVHFIHVKSPHERALPLIHHPRLARLDHRDARGDRPADRPDRARRRRRGRVRLGGAVHPGIRLLGASRPSSAGGPAASGRRGGS